MKLTKKQQEVLGFISRYREEWGQSPSFDEICSHFGFNSYNTVTTYLKILERKGYIRLPGKKNQKRAIEVISPVETRRFEFPLLGKVAAGRPIEAVEDVDVIEVPPSMIGSGNHFVLQVKGTRPSRCTSRRPRPDRRRSKGTRTRRPRRSNTPRSPPGCQASCTPGSPDR